jgi:hypothetical protein
MANERLTLQLNVETVGEQSVNKLADSLTKVVSIADLAGKSTGPAFAQLPAQLKSYVEDPAGSAEAALASFASRFGVIGGVVGGAAAAFGSFALISATMTRALADLGDQTDDLALQLGLTTKEVGQFDFAAKSTGDTVDVFVGAMRKLSEGLTDGSAAGDKARSALDKLGVRTRTATGELAPMSEIFLQIGAGINKMGDAASRNATMVDLFGKAGISLLPVLSSLNERVAYAKAADFGLDEATVERYNEWKKRIVEVDTAWETAKRHLAEKIVGTIWIELKGAGAKLLEGKFAGPDGLWSGKPSKDATGSPRGVTAEGPTFAELFPGGNLAGEANVPAGSKRIADVLKNWRETTIEGLQESVAKAKEKVEAAGLAMKSSQGQVGDSVAKTLVGNWRTAASELEHYQLKLKALTQREAERMALLDRIAKLNREGTPFLNLGNVVVSSQEQANASRVRVAPTLRTVEEMKRNLPSVAQVLASDSHMQLVGASSIMAARRASPENEAASDALAGQIASLRQGREDKFGGRYLTDADRAELDRLEKKFAALEEQLNSVRKKTGFADAVAFVQTYQEHRDSYVGPSGTAEGYAQQNATDQQKRLLQLRNEFDITARVLAMRAGPGGEYEAAVKTSQLRVSAAEQQFAVDGDINKLWAERYGSARDSEMALLDLQERRMQGYRSMFGGLWDSLRGGGSGIAGFAKAGVLGIGKTVFENAGKEYIMPVIEKLLPRSTNALLKGTPFFDPQMKAAQSLDVAGLKLQGAADALTAAAGGSGLGTVAGAAGGAGTVASGVASGVSGAAGSASRFASLAKYGLVAAAATGGTIAAVQDFQRGGAGGITQGLGAVAGVAGAVLPLLSKSLAMAGPIGAIAGIGLSLLGNIIGDSKEKRSRAISRELEGSVYHAPTALDLTQDGSGNYVDFDARGGLRTSAFRAMPRVSQGYTWWGPGRTPYEVPGGVQSPYGAPVTINIHAVDAGSFHEFAQRNAAAFGDAAATHLQNTESRLASQLRYMMAGA